MNKQEVYEQYPKLSDFIHDNCSRVVEPIFEHDCEACIFLGGIGSISDIYFCEQGGISNTIIVREGDEGWEYGSSGYGFRTVDKGGFVIEVPALYERHR